MGCKGCMRFVGVGCPASLCLRRTNSQFLHSVVILIGRLNRHLPSQVSKKNLMEIVKKLMLHVDKAEGTTYRDELLTKIIDICSQSNYQYITNFEWSVSSHPHRFVPTFETSMSFSTV